MQVNLFIQRTITKGGGCLVHCEGGISRSVTLIIAFLMFSQQLSFQNAYQKIKTIRSEIQPNNGFIQQLQSYELFLPKIYLELQDMKWQKYLKLPLLCGVRLPIKVWDLLLTRFLTSYDLLQVKQLSSCFSVLI